MKLLICHNQALPVSLYGGTERIAWDLAKSLSRAGHEVSLLLPPKSRSDFAKVYSNRDIAFSKRSFFSAFDFVHTFYPVDPNIFNGIPYLTTQQGNAGPGENLKGNYNFVSKNHAERHGSKTWVYNGLDWDNYPKFQRGSRREKSVHFLGKASWDVKNLKGAITVSNLTGFFLDVLGGQRFSRRKPWIHSLSSKVRFHGEVDNIRKAATLQKSSGLLFPVIWNEPFGLAVIESLYYGCPVFATPHGSLGEIVIDERFGCLSPKASELAEAIMTLRYDPEICHKYALHHFSAEVMAKNYLSLYSRILDGETFEVPSTPIDKREKMAWINE